MGMKTSAPQSPKIKTIHGFRVLPISPITKAFMRALKLIASRRFADLLCVIVKTKWGWKFGDPPVDGRYVHSSHPFSPAVISMMKDQGIDPPPMPFLFAPIPTLLYHEWGHHVDFCWSRDAYPMLFSTSWFSHFYKIGFSDSFRSFLNRNQSSADPSPDILECAVEWHLVMSELFAQLFEDWIRGSDLAASCDPKSLNSHGLTDAQFLKFEFQNGVNSSVVREKTYSLFNLGLEGPDQIPEVCPDLFGSGTSRAFARLKEAMSKCASNR